MPGTIVVGVDASSPSRAALAWAVERARIQNAHLELLHAVDDSDRPSAERLLAARVAKALAMDGELSVTGELVEGRADEALVHRSMTCDLLVIGTHKTGFIYGRTFGSQFIDLAWRAGSDLAYIPELVGSDRQGVVVSAQASDEVLHLAAAEAAREHEELTVVASWPTASRRPRSTDDLRWRVDGMARAVRVVREGHPQLRVRTRVSESLNAQALVEASAHAALLVVGRPEDGALASTSRSVNHDVLVNLASPVLIVREKE